MKRQRHFPLSLKIVYVTLKIKIVIFYVLCVVALLLLQDFDQGSLISGFKKGFIRPYGYDLQTYTAGSAGEIIGRHFIGITFVLLGMHFLDRKKIFSLGIVLSLSFLVSLSSGAFQVLWSILILSLVFTKSSREFMKTADQ